MLWAFGKATDPRIGGDRQRGAVRGRPALVGVSDNLAAEAGGDGNETEQDGREGCDTQRAEDAPIRTFPLADDHPRNPDRAQHEQRAQPERARATGEHRERCHRCQDDRGKAGASSAPPQHHARHRREQDRVVAGPRRRTDQPARDPRTKWQLS